MHRTLALAIAACVWALPAAAVNVTVDFVGVVTDTPVVIPFDPFPVASAASETAEGATLGSADLAPISPGIIIEPFPDPPEPSPGETVSGRLSFEISQHEEIENVSGSLPIVGANPLIDSATASPVERLCAEPCFTIGPVPPPLIPLDETHDRGTLSVEYGPNTIFGPSHDISFEWIEASILIAALVDPDAPPSSFFDLIQLPGALPIEVNYTRVTRGNLALPGEVDPRDCSVFSCSTYRATVTSGSIRIGDGPTPIPAPPALVALLTALGALAGLRRPA